MDRTETLCLISKNIEKISQGYLILLLVIERYHLQYNKSAMLSVGTENVLEVHVK